MIKKKLQILSRPKDIFVNVISVYVQNLNANYEKTEDIVRKVPRHERIVLRGNYDTMFGIEKDSNIRQWVVVEH